MRANDLSVQDFRGAKWLLLSGYCFYGQNLLQRAVELASQAGVKVALDLASFEVVQSFKPQLRKILESGKVHCCFCNEVSALLGTHSAVGASKCHRAVICNNCELQSSCTGTAALIATITANAAKEQQLQSTLRPCQNTVVVIALFCTIPATHGLTGDCSLLVSSACQAKSDMLDCLL